MLENNDLASELGPASDPVAEAARADVIAGVLAEIVTEVAQEKAPPGAKVVVGIKSVEHEIGYGRDEALYHFEGRATLIPLAPGRLDGDVPPPSPAVPLLPSPHELEELREQTSLLPQVTDQPASPPSQEAPIYGVPQTVTFWFGGVNLRTGEMFSTPEALEKGVDDLAGRFVPKLPLGLESPLVEPQDFFSLGKALNSGKDIAAAVAGALFREGMQKLGEDSIEAWGKNWFGAKPEGRAPLDRHDVDAVKVLADVVKALRELGEDTFNEAAKELRASREESEAPEDSIPAPALVSTPTWVTDAEFFGPSTPEPTAPTDTPPDPSPTPAGSQDRAPQRFDVAEEVRQNELNLEVEANREFNLVETAGTPGEAQPGVQGSEGVPMGFDPSGGAPDAMGSPVGPMGFDPSGGAPDAMGSPVGPMGFDPSEGSPEMSESFNQSPSDALPGTEAGADMSGDSPAGADAD
ncbi:hypothetical protein EV652_1032 [Kribbella steppae]|uniref:Uncharacterized protein n=1 Tax=Kribbella steppae TaxID=2512223 RepID=A0A4R2HP85_9ACTN|nr:hypothetical protein [Kribbella steppae]TCO33003.1 hypothetical protein EV652_1032 [Kribbella steppae]